MQPNMTETDVLAWPNTLAASESKRTCSEAA